MSITLNDFESGLKHLASCLLTDIENNAKNIVALAKKEWPTVEDLVSSPQLGADVLKALQMIIPLLDFLKTTFPDKAALFSWIETIIQDIETLAKAIDTCNCPACTK